MSLLPLVLATSGLAILLAPVLQARLGRNAGWPLAVLYLLSAALLTPVAARVLAGHKVSASVDWVPRLQISFSLNVDALGLIFAYIALLIGAVVLVYSTKYLSAERQKSFFVVMTTFTLSMLVLVFTSDLFLVFICWEITSISSFLLIARSGQPGEAASMRTLWLTFIGGMALLIAVALIYAHVGTSNFAVIVAHPIWVARPAFTSLVAVLVAIAAFTKSAQFPFHVWLPDAMAAITPVSAYLHAAAVVKAGIFLLLRFSPLFHLNIVWNVGLISAGLVTTLVGGWFALQQTDLKKLMAYSTVSQLGLIVAAIGVGTELAISAALLHTIAHALFKSGLFMMVGVIDHATHTRDLRRLPPRLYRAMPVSFGITIAGCASMAGLPPLLGFISKEEILAAIREAPGPDAVGWGALLATVVGAVLTLSYCLKIVCGAFIDGREDRRAVQRQHAVLVGAAGLPIAVSLPLALGVGIFDPIVSRANDVARGTLSAHTHFHLWHGVSLELGLTAVVIAVGIVVLWQRHRLFAWCERHPFPTTGAEVIQFIKNQCTRVGQLLNRPIAHDHATRHLMLMLGSFAVLGLLGTALVTRRGLPAQIEGLTSPIDVVILVLMAVAIAGVVISRSRLGATVALSAVGVLATAQILALGAPDVSLTQLLVEALTVIVIMLVLQRLPRDFPVREFHRRNVVMALSVLVGASVAALSWALMGRRPRSPLAQYYIDNTERIAGGKNIVNIILVEFRAMDTMGELAVLGMTAVAMVAVFSTVRNRHLDPPDRRLRGIPPEKLPLRQHPESTAYRAIMTTWPNVIPLQLMLRVINPVLVFITILLFLRGHNEPGGGFNAALVACALVGLIYLSTSTDRQIGPPKMSLYLIGGGISLAVATGIAGLVWKHSFLQPIHVHWLGLHLTSSMVFDLGVYLAVIGLLVLSFNLLGATMLSRELTRERADQAYEGDLPGPLDTVRGERVKPSTTLVSDGTRPQEVGR